MSDDYDYGYLGTHYRVNGFISRPYQAQRRKPPKQNKIKIPVEKHKLVVENIVKIKKPNDAKKTLITIIGNNQEYNVSELAQELGSTYITLSKIVAGIESLTINNIDYKVVVNVYSVNVYKDGKLFERNILAKDAAEIIGCSLNKVRSLKIDNKMDSNGWSVKSYEG